MTRKIKKSDRRKARVRAKIKGTAKKPRLSVFRSNQSIYAQLIDDQKAVTLVAVRDKDFQKVKKEPKSLTKTEKAGLVGEKIAQKAVKLGIKEVVFDRGSCRYHGRVKALAEGARGGGLNF